MGLGHVPCALEAYTCYSYGYPCSSLYMVLLLYLRVCLLVLLGAVTYTELCTSGVNITQG